MRKNNEMLKEKMQAEIGEYRELAGKHEIEVPEFTDEELSNMNTDTLKRYKAMADNLSVDIDRKIYKKGDEGE